MPDYDLIIRNGTIYDGSGSAPYRGDVAIQGDSIAALGDLGDAKAAREMDVNGLAVAPGFINMLSWAVESLIFDGRSQSEIRQGVTLEVMGEGESMGPLSEKMKDEWRGGILGNSDIKYDLEWTTLGEYLEFLERRGVSTNIASFVGSSTLRIHEIGYDDRLPDDEELERMKALVRQAMEEGAMGMSAALIYPPASYADTEELIELASVVAEYGGMYISHIRSEGSTFIEALGEFLEIVEESGARGEIYHLKAAGKSNWDKMDEAIKIIEQARADGLPVTADMYAYPFSGTGLSSCIPAWAHEGGHKALIARLKDPETRERIKGEMKSLSTEWENMFAENAPNGILLAGFKNDALKPLTGKRLGEVAEMRGTSLEDTLMDLIVEDDSRIFTMYFSMSEDNLRKQMALPWVSFCSDAESMAPEGVFLKSNPHPRAYGSFARVLGKYVRDEKIITIEEAVRRLAALPAENLRIERRGTLKEGNFADVVVFDPDKVQDYATPEKPHQYSTGMVHVFVNGVQVLQDGEHTDAKPGRVVRGPSYQKKPFEFAYPSALHPLLTLGETYNGDYSEFTLDKDVLPDLIHMAGDVKLHFLPTNQPQAYAPMHAWRRLGQLGAVEAIPHVTPMWGIVKPQMMREIPVVLSMMGPPAIPFLVQQLESFDIAFSHIASIMGLKAIADDWGETVGAAVEDILITRLKNYRNQFPILNSQLIAVLMDMGTDARDLIAEVYRNSTVMPEIAGTWSETRDTLGIPPSKEDRKIEQRSMEEPDEFNVPSPSFPRKADSKKKAKRKQADKMKKLNRKKKR